jgi:hypothetical protein
MNLLPVDLAEGQNADLVWQLASPRPFAVRVQLAEPDGGARPVRAMASFALLTAEGVPVLRWTGEVAVGEDGFVTIEEEAVPGDYALSLTLDGRAIDERLSIADADEQEFEFPLR